MAALHTYSEIIKSSQKLRDAFFQKGQQYFQPTRRLNDIALFSKALSTEKNITKEQVYQWLDEQEKILTDQKTRNLSPVLKHNLVLDLTKKFSLLYKKINRESLMTVLDKESIKSVFIETMTAFDPTYEIKRAVREVAAQEAAQQDEETQPVPVDVHTYVEELTEDIEVYKETEIALNQIVDDYARELMAEFSHITPARLNDLAEYRITKRAL